MKALLARSLGLLCAVSSLAACHEPVASTPISGNAGTVTIPSAGAINADKERYYAEQLPILQAKNPEADAKAAIANNDRYFLCNAGRSSTVPGLEAAVYAQASAHCQTRCLDGVTDAISGENHRRYLSAALTYSARWNQTMLSACR